jgi:predicted transcriptional regulator
MYETKEISELLDITQPAVSKYINDKVGMVSNLIRKINNDKRFCQGFVRR